MSLRNGTPWPWCQIVIARNGLDFFRNALPWEKTNESPLAPSFNFSSFFFGISIMTIICLWIYTPYREENTNAPYWSRIYEVTLVTLSRPLNIQSLRRFVPWRFWFCQDCCGTPPPSSPCWEGACYLLAACISSPTLGVLAYIGSFSSLAPSACEPTVDIVPRRPGLTHQPILVHHHPATWAHDSNKLLVAETIVALVALARSGDPHNSPRGGIADGHWEGLPPCDHRVWTLYCPPGGRFRCGRQNVLKGDRNVRNQTTRKVMRDHPLVDRDGL